MHAVWALSRGSLAVMAVTALLLVPCTNLGSRGLAPQAAMSPPLPCRRRCTRAVAEAAVSPAMPQFAPAPLPYQVTGAWAPPGIALPWPEDEYVRDGGDDGSPVTVSPDWTVYGLELEDTVAHFDTTDGRTMIEPRTRSAFTHPASAPCAP